MSAVFVCIAICQALCTDPFTAAQQFDQSLLRVCVDGEYGYINRAGELVIAPQFVDAGRFSEGLAWASRDKEKYGFIDESGDFVIEPQFAYIAYPASFHGGRAYILQKHKFGYIDRQGVFVIPPIYDQPGEFEDGFARVGTATFLGKIQLFFAEDSSEVEIAWSYIDVDGNPLGETASRTAAGVNPALLLPLAKKDNEKFGYVGADGRFVIPPKFESANRFQEGLAAVRTNHGVGFINTSGSLVIPPEFKGTESFQEGLAVVRVDRSPHPDQIGFIDKQGRMVIAPQFIVASSFSEGLAAVQFEQDQLWGYIDRAGRVVIESRFDFALEFCDGVAQVIVNGKHGYINRQGEYIWQPSN